jgi:CHASE1-domain containing sensor protein
MRDGASCLYLWPAWRPLLPAGASGQTTVTEEDVRRFIFPKAVLKDLDKVASKIEKERKVIAAARAALDAQEADIWKTLGGLLQSLAC